MKITDELIELGLLETAGKAPSTGGKRADLLRFVFERIYIVGVEISKNSIWAAVFDGKAHQMAVSTVETQFTSLNSFCSSIADLVEHVIAESGVKPSSVLGIGITLPAAIERDTCIMRDSPILPWKNVDILMPIINRLNLAAVVVDSNRAIAMCEGWFGANAGSRDYVCLNLSDHIGVGVATGGVIMRGATGLSPDIGHVAVEKDGFVCECGNKGCLNAMASSTAIRNWIIYCIKKNARTTMTAEAGPYFENVDASFLFRHAQTGDPFASGITKRVIGYLSSTAINLINVFDPEYLILTGEMTRAGTFFVDALMNEIDKRQAVLGRRVKLAVSGISHGAPLGAASHYIKYLIASGAAGYEGGKQSQKQLHS